MAKKGRSRGHLKLLLLVFVMAIVTIATIILFSTFHASNRFDIPFTSSHPLPSTSPTFNESLTIARLESYFRHNHSSYETLFQFIQEAYPKLSDRLAPCLLSQDHLLLQYGPNQAIHPPLLLLIHIPYPSAMVGHLDQIQHHIYGSERIVSDTLFAAALEAFETLASLPMDRMVYIGLGNHTNFPTYQQYFLSHNIHLGLVLEEGFQVTKGFISGIEQPVAMVGVAEKGFLQVKLSLPSPTTLTDPIYILSKAITRLRESIFPSSLSIPLRWMFAFVLHRLPIFLRLFLANLWLTEPLVLKAMQLNPHTNEAIRTTFHFDELTCKGETCFATLSLHLSLRDTIDGTVAYIRRIIDDDRIAIDVLMGIAPSPITDISSPSFHAVYQSIGQVFEFAFITPSILLRPSHTHPFWECSDSIVRFTPFQIDKDTFQPANPRVRLYDFVQMIDFYHLLALQ